MVTTMPATPITPLTIRHPLGAGTTAAALWIARQSLMTLGTAALLPLLLWVVSIDLEAFPEQASYALLALLTGAACVRLGPRWIQRRIDLHTPGQMAPKTEGDPEVPWVHYVPEVIGHAVRAALLVAALYWTLQLPLALVPSWLSPDLNTGAFLAVLMLVSGGILFTIRVLDLVAHWVMVPFRGLRRPVITELHPVLLVITAGGILVVAAQAILRDDAGVWRSEEVVALAFAITALSAVIWAFVRTGLGPVVFREVVPAEDRGNFPPGRPAREARRPWAARLTEQILTWQTGSATLEDTQRYTSLVRIAAFTLAGMLLPGVFMVMQNPGLITLPMIPVLIWAWSNRRFLRDQFNRLTAANQGARAKTGEPGAVSPKRRFLAGLGLLALAMACVQLLGLGLGSLVDLLF